MTISTTALTVIFALLVMLATYLAYRASQSKEYRFDLEDLVLDPLTGKASLSKLGQFVALSVSTWGFVFLTVGGKLTEFYFGTYMAAWAGTSLANTWINRQPPPTHPDPKEPE